MSDRFGAPRLDNTGRHAAGMVWFRFVCWLACAGLLAHAAPATAKILKTRKGVKQLELTLGSAFEFETDNEHTQYEMPLLAEYAFTQTITLSVEPNYIVMHSKTEDPSLHGWGDLETTVTWEGIDEYHWRPAFSLESTIKWPTASNSDFGSGHTDYSLGFILTKTRRAINVDADVIYTWVGTPKGAGNADTFEASLALEWAVSYVFDLEAEIVTSTQGVRGRAGTISGIGGAEPAGNETEGTLGLAEHFLERLKLEEGAVFKSDGSWQLVFAWEWEFGTP